ncbi:acetylcholine receptor subunit epsilon isoform X3 [Microcaecilia unicolor]|uniref:Acetylcholine receptor subunit epsilon n=1 Tax=Microcaecilia unicolor TaxID=1415580 RepID=A0A6P7X104_9AMPH|nr:acetylcholine receptor subunit epsilon isoform X3 [Microcaecilia unicolor]
MKVFLLISLLCTFFHAIPASHEQRLFQDLFSDYDKETRPSQSVDDVVSVQLKLTLTNLISLNEKMETLTTNVWLEITWIDYRLTWNLSAYDNIDKIRVPFDNVWLPDIVLENKSQTYSANEIDLQLALNFSTNETVEWVDIDPPAFTENGEWAIKHRPAKKVINKKFSPGDLEYQEILFNLVIQRKPLFYIINIIAPCVLMSSLLVLVFFLPAQAGGQKCTLSISVLLGQTIFLFLIAQKVPETSLSVPLIGKYLIFVMTMSTLVVLNCVVVLNVSLRTPTSHSMSRKIKHVFLEVLPVYLGMHLQPSDDPCDISQPRRRSSFGIMLKAEEYILKKPRSELMFEWLKCRYGLNSAFSDKYVDGTDVDGTDMEITTTLYKNLALCAPAIKECVEACNFIAESTKEQNSVDAEMLNWKLIGKVIDKICFWAALLLFTIGTLAIFLNGHFNTVPEYPFPGDSKRYLPE